MVVLSCLAFASSFSLCIAYWGYKLLEYPLPWFLNFLGPEIITYSPPTILGLMIIFYLAYIIWRCKESCDTEKRKNRCPTHIKKCIKEKMLKDELRFQERDLFIDEKQLA